MALINCPECKREVSDAAKSCPHCGFPFADQSNVATKKHKVTIFRESQMYLINPPVNISMNGQKKYSIANGGTVELELSEGNYSFEFSSSLRSKQLNLNLSKDTLITLKWNRLTGSLDLIVA